MLVDAHHRRLTYLRLSLTDRCNLRCVYCMPEHGVAKLRHEDILAYEEFLLVVRAARSEGMVKLRLTGGEPLVRRGVLDFIRELARLPGPLDLCLTTNGVLLAGMAADLRAAGVRRVNISLDSLDPRNYSRITGRDEFPQVWAGLEAALAAGFDRVKVNVVAIRGLNDHELPAFARLSLDLPLEVRFIEYMPLGRLGYWSPQKFISSAEIKARLAPAGPLTPLPPLDGDGPARLFRLPQAAGTLGFISPVTEHFCARCNRLRLTADGKLRLCLLSNLEIDLKAPLRAGASEEDLARLLRQAVQAKPRGHDLARRLSAASNRSMNLIGG